MNFDIFFFSQLIKQSPRVVFLGHNKGDKRSLLVVVEFASVSSLVFA